MSGNRRRAEDLVQETIAWVWRHPGALAGRPGGPWLFAVARTPATGSCRARPARPAELSETALTRLPSDDDADRMLEARAAAGALASWRPDHRRVIAGIYYRATPPARQPRGWAYRRVP